MTQLPISQGEDHDGMAYYTRHGTESASSLPLRNHPIRFAVMRKDGLSSNAWRVWVDPAGNAFIACRDHMQKMKVSLHQSGKQHIAFNSESDIEMTKGSRFWNQWAEPQYYDGSKVIPTFNLFFPDWALTLTEEMRQAKAKIWNKNSIFVEAAESPLATIISFVITNEDLEMRFNTVGQSPSFPLGILPVRSGKKLWIVVQHAVEGNMKELAGKGISAAAASTDMEPNWQRFPDGHVFGMCVTGPTNDGGAYWMPFSVEMHLTLTRIHRRDVAMPVREGM